jgi:hypothetical protein
MIELAVVAALAAVAGGVVAVTARDGRAVALGLAVAVVAASFAASPLPGTLSLVARIAGAMLAADLLWVATRVKAVRSDGSAIGLAAETAIAAAAFLVGLWIAPVKPLPGPVAEQAAGLALVALAVIPLLGKDVLRVGAGAALLAVGISLLHEAWLGPAQSFENLALAALLVGILGATGLLIAPAAEERGATNLGRSIDEGVAGEGFALGAASVGAMAGAADAAGVTAAPDVAAEAEAEPLRPAARAGATVRRIRHPRGEPRP